MSRSVSSSALLYRPGSVTEASWLLTDEQQCLVPLAGATWLMRSPLRREPWAAGYVSLGAVPELRVVERRPDEFRLGASLTHAQLAAATAGNRDVRVLHQAAAHSANPAVRARATLGGNLCTADFAAADLTPALLSLDARVAVLDSAGPRELPLAEHLRTRGTAGPRRLLTEVIVPRRRRLSGHARLPLRRAGDYPVAILSVAFTPDNEGIVRDMQVAVGSVEPVARRWREVERLLVGHPADPELAERVARECTGALRGRDGVEAPGWYRERVAPALLRRAMAAALAPDDLTAADGPRRSR
ncbi:FAD binding domain-containing protein [Streptomyces tubercidicus]|uniref:FAD binding domain-containing protein n=1 Tax=Streptomyces tubercidicus TaxID=47759 RepID=UPI00346538C7